VNATTVKEFVALPRHFGLCNHQDVALDDQKDESHLAPSKGHVTDVSDTTMQTAAKRLCGVLATSVWSSEKAS
jgi:hypothetical protein